MYSINNFLFFCLNLLQDKDKGFSLVEAAIVIAVLSIFSAVAIPAFNCVRRRAISTAAQETIRKIKEECETNYIYGIDKFTSSNPDKYQITASGSNSCSGGTVTLTPEDTNLYPTYLYNFADSELSYNFKGQTGTSFVACNKLICGDGGVTKKINLDQDFIVANTYKERGCSGYVLVEGPSWSEAQANANKLGGNLVTINDKEENDWIFKNFEQISTGSNEGLGVMIGITDDEEEGTWKWISGEKVTYSNWGTNQPDNSRGLENRSVIGWDRGTWNDIQEDWDNLQTTTKWGEVKGLVEVSICN